MSAVRALSSRFGDLRLTKRYRKILKQLDSQTHTSIPSIMGNVHQTKGFYRFVNNMKVTASLLSASMSSDSYQSARFLSEPVVLSVQDTTELCYNKKRSAPNLNCLQKSYLKGVFLDACLLSSGSGSILGIGGLHYYDRKAGTVGNVRANREKKGVDRLPPAAPKTLESYRWVQGFLNFQAQIALHPDKTGIHIMDREADMFSLFSARTISNAHFIVRSKHDRVLGKNRKLWHNKDVTTACTTHTIEVYDANRTKRKASLLVSFATVDIPPTRGAEKGTKPIQCAYVKVHEQEAPKGQVPICWHLLTSLEVTNDQQAWQVVSYYVLRWLIERFFYVLKKGVMQVEDLQIEKPQALKNAITLKCYSAMTILALKTETDNQPQKDLTETNFTHTDYRIAYEYVKNNQYPHIQQVEKPTVADFTKLIASIGGQKPNAKKVGLVYLARGWENFTLIRKAYLTFHPNSTQKDVGNG